MKVIYDLLPLLTERFPPAAGSDGHKIALSKGAVTLALYSGLKWYLYEFDDADLKRSVEDLLDGVVTLHQAALDREDEYLCP